ncbi:MAG: hypothetical protein HYU70_13100 [Bacteroidetes bacterium]|nr:hypothetical protein [Bacteroidota bacterium]
MKIATYHRMLGDQVKFFKGDLKDLVLDELAHKCISRLKRLDAKRNWKDHIVQIRSFIQFRNPETIDLFIYRNSKNKIKLLECLNDYSTIYRSRKHELFPKWDRVYVTTLFTFYWNITVKTIKFAKNLVNDHSQIMIGGVLASLLHAELEIETGIKPHRGLLDTPGMLDPGNAIAKDLVIDNLPLDYSILEETAYQYPTGSAYFTFMTKGCTRKCAFCSVPILEPTYKPKIDTIDKFNQIKEIYGEQQNLLLMDNNVLASPNFPEIIDEIKRMGFTKGATFIEPNQLEIAIKNLRAGLNDYAYIKRTHRLYNDLLRRLKSNTKSVYQTVLEQCEIIDFHTTTKAGLLRAYNSVKDLYEKHRNKQPKLRYVDFNQGTDARYVTDELMKLMSEIPIRPLRIAFDYWGLREKYEAAVRLAAQYGLQELSNYILYNFNDTPDELYNRLQINVLLNEELGTKIFSFPMKYIPLFGEEAKDRDFIGKKWNKKYIRAIQSILNVTKGIVAPGKSLFIRAFGKDLQEFNEILYMPEEYIVYRQYFDNNGFIAAWRENYYSLSPEERAEAFPIIHSNDFRDFKEKTTNEKIRKLLRHYTITKTAARRIQLFDLEYKQSKKVYEKLVKKDIGINLTLTYDFEATVARKKHKSKAIV